MTAKVCGKTSLLTKKVIDFDWQVLSAKVMASAAAVPSSSIEALAISMPVKSINIC